MGGRKRSAADSASLLLPSELLYIDHGERVINNPQTVISTNEPSQLSHCSLVRSVCVGLRQREAPSESVEK